MSKVIIVDENDNIIGAKDRLELKPEEIYRVSGLWVYNSKGEVLIAQRQFNKISSPGKWGPSCAGTIEEGETYDSNVKKEAQEELGISGFDFQKGLKQRRRGGRNYFRQLYYLKLDWPVERFKIQKAEVAQIRWIEFSQLLMDVKNHPEDYTPSFKNASILEELEVKISS